MQLKELEVMLNTCEVSTLDYFRFSNGTDEIIFRKTPEIINEPSSISSGLIQARPETANYIEQTADINASPSDNTGLANTEEENENTAVIISNFVGIIAFSDKLKSDEEIKVTNGEILCTIEAMKIYNEVVSDKTGTLVEILVNDGDMIEYEQELFRIKVME